MTCHELLALAAPILAAGCKADLAKPNSSVRKRVLCLTEKKRFSSERIVAFVKELLSRIEAMDIVERYACFHGGVSGGPLPRSKFFNADVSLTVVGEAYRSVG